MNDRIRVALFDDNKDLRDMFRLLVDAQPDMVCVAVHPDLSHMMRDLDATRPDVIVMDIEMPGMNGIAGIGAIRQRHPEARILMQTVFESDEKVFAAVCAGANGYILKSAPVDEIVRAIRDVHAGGSAMTPVIARKVLERFRTVGTTGATDDHGLSDREKEVLGLLVRGHSYKMVAASLGLSVHTVDTHIRHIYRKLHVSCLAEAVGKAVKDRLV
ncbi:MAG: response regulator transcription factor [Flavobacteriales bacterium]|nr:Oxygen regulatory protein NreC [Flavobacteriales bacterium]MCC6578536.1 response regulator transcription factor [Flavobacteriales bacterium]NUQ15611.1 response regulator transcription factor [Flavobacteriales bacterium]